MNSALSLKDITRSFDGKQVLKGLSFTLSEREVIGLVGPSGGGKTVLLKILGRVLSADSGTIEFNGEPLATGFLFQEGALFDSETVLENVAFPLLRTPRGEAEGFSRDGCYDAAYVILREVGLKDAIQKYPGQLSGGMRRRVALARALVGNPRLCLLDDPTGGLDPVAASVIMELIAEQSERLKPIILMVSHDLRRLLPRVERVLSLFDGSIVHDCRTEELAATAPEYVLEFLRTRYDFSEEQQPHP